MALVFQESDGSTTFWILTSLRFVTSEKILFAIFKVEDEGKEHLDFKVYLVLFHLINN